MKNLLPKDGSLIVIDHFISSEKSEQLFKILLHKVKWEQKEIVIYDKKHNIPRLTAWFGESNYSYSGIKNQSQNWLPELLILKEYVEKKLKQSFNSCLLNLYRDGKDHVSWHSDNEKELGIDPVIVSISLGESRTFQVKHKLEKDLKISIETNPGTLILMSGDMQSHWLHRISPTNKERSKRINITFRNIK